MPDRLVLVSLVAAATSYVTPQRMWLERLAFIIPSPAATRWLLVADAVCLVSMAVASGRPRIAVPLALGLGFLAVNLAGMILTDFYLGLAVVHLATGSATVLFAGRWRWIGATALGLTLALGVLS